MEHLILFLHNERTLYLITGVVGIISVIIGLLFLFFSYHKSFAVTMIVMGILEMAVMFPVYLRYQQKIDHKVLAYENNKTKFLKLEYLSTQKTLKSFFWLKFIYSILIVTLILTMSALPLKIVLHGIFTALILHFSFAITIDNFGEKYTQKYWTEFIVRYHKSLD